MEFFKSCLTLFFSLKTDEAMTRTKFTSCNLCSSTINQSTSFSIIVFRSAGKFCFIVQYVQCMSNHIFELAINLSSIKVVVSTHLITFFLVSSPICLLLIRFIEVKVFLSYMSFFNLILNCPNPNKCLGSYSIQITLFMQRNDLKFHFCFEWQLC